MFKQSDDDDDLFYSMGTSSKLASLFDISVVPDNKFNTSNASLTYSAPKQPQTPSKSNLKTNSSPKSQSNVSLVKLVHTYKFVDSLYQPLGKLGLAFVESPANGQFSLILYKDKTNPTLNMKISSKIQFTIQDDLYLTFYDDQNQNWSLLFENIDDITQFENKLCTVGTKIIKTNSNKENTDKNITASRKEISKSELSLEEASKVQPHTHGEDSGFSLLKSTEILKLDPNESSNTEKDGTSSDDKTKKTKQQILSRMAKMGQPVILPITKPDSSNQKTSVDSTDDSTEKDENRVEVIENVRSKKKRSVKKLPDPVDTQCTALIPTTPENVITTFVPVSTHTSDMNSLVAENRTHNTEMRLNLMKIDNKIDMLMDRLRLENELALKNEMMSLKLQNEQLKLDVQRIQLFQENSRRNPHEPQLAARNLIDFSVQTDLVEEPDNIKSLENSQDEIENQLKQSNEEIDRLNAKYLKTLNDLEVLQKKNTIIELKMKDFEDFYFEHRPLPKIPNENGEFPNITEVSQSNKELLKDLLDLMNQMREIMVDLQHHHAKVTELKIYFEKNKIEENTDAKSSIVTGITAKLDELENYFSTTNELKFKIDNSLITLKSYEDKIHNQETKLNDTIGQIHKQSQLCTECQEKCKDIDNVKKEVHDLQVNVSAKDLEIDELKIKIMDLENQLKGNNDSLENKIKTSISPIVKEEMNVLYSNLQDKLIDDSKSDVTSLIVHATYRIINSIESQLSLKQ